MSDFNRDSGGRSFGRRDFGPRRFDRGGGRGGGRPMFKSTCGNCGNECELPFRPTNGKPVYCRSCFEKMGGRRTDFRNPSSDQNKAQFEALNVKLDRILRLLEPNVAAKAPAAQDPAKVKKAATKASSTKKN